MSSAMMLIIGAGLAVAGAIGLIMSVIIGNKRKKKTLEKLSSEY